MPENHLKVRPLVGGIRIVTHSKIGTLGLVVMYEGDKCFVTAGHVFGAKDKKVGQPDDAHVVGELRENFLHADTPQDIALVSIAPGVEAALNQIWTNQGTRTVQFGASVLPGRGSRVWLEGMASGTLTGTVLEPDVDITVPETNEVARNVVLVEFDNGIQTQDGDSGAPVVGEGTEICFGVYGGRVKHDGKYCGWFTPFDNLVWD
ncbi:S1 family peptidase [Burkholderia sp. FERM BP-3421]|jgi:hypothetical protein|uniref:trypsin-like serine protease n=1 Tax=Burkholderia sp. FERM BP-3421 TaxID=1494466 RepID=UPI00235E1ACF|nr:trypsin-like serine protease [Burkholderia sp. FERM BP-3421]WDD94852.1 S1 family peptidase [Burkholderia sp. FERM BP-3421]